MVVAPGERTTTGGLRPRSQPRTTRGKTMTEKVMKRRDAVKQRVETYVASLVKPDGLYRCGGGVCAKGRILRGSDLIDLFRSDGLMQEWVCSKSSNRKSLIRSSLRSEYQALEHAKIDYLIRDVRWILAEPVGAIVPPTERTTTLIRIFAEIDRRVAEENTANLGFTITSDCYDDSYIPAGHSSAIEELCNNRWYSNRTSHSDLKRLAILLARAEIRDLRKEFSDWAQGCLVVYDEEDSLSVADDKPVEAAQQCGD